MNNNRKIKVTVKFFATLREYGPKKEDLLIPTNSRVELLFTQYKIPKNERKAIILINGRPHKDEDTVLNDGDIIAIFPPIGGG